MFIGSYYHKLETKGRLSLPKAYRSQSESWVVTPGLDGGLFLFPQTDFNQQLQELATLQFNKKQARDFIRLMTNQAQLVTPDQLGRILIPESLIALAQLQQQVVVVGSLNRVEIWDQNRYHALLDQLNQNAESIAESIEWPNSSASNQNSQNISPLPSPQATEELES